MKKPNINTKSIAALEGKKMPFTYLAVSKKVYLFQE
jgi:hypothetical protein